MIGSTLTPFAFLGSVEELIQALYVVAPVLLGGCAVYLLLPRPKPFPSIVGAAFGALALLLGSMFLVHTGAVTTDVVLFYTFSGIAILAGGVMITQHNPAYAALSFALVVLSTCGLFLLQAAPFLMASTIIVYAGAIIVTFLFVLMLAQQHGPSDADDRSREPMLATLTAFVLLGALLSVIRLAYDPTEVDSILQKYLPAAQVAMSKETAEETSAALPEHFFSELVNELSAYEEDLGDGQRVPPALKAYRMTIDDEISSEWIRGKVQGGPKGFAQMQHALQRLEEETNRLHAETGRQRPAMDLPLSPFSGPPPNGGGQWDARGEAKLPAENVAALGKSLFTDFLLAVELGGTLLLVATVGAIAIAHRGGERS